MLLYIVFHITSLYHIYPNDVLYTQNRIMETEVQFFRLLQCAKLKSKKYSRYICFQMLHLCMCMAQSKKKKKKKRWNFTEIPLLDLFSLFSFIQLLLRIQCILQKYCQYSLKHNWGKTGNAEIILLRVLQFCVINIQLCYSNLNIKRMWKHVCRNSSTVSL